MRRTLMALLAMTLTALAVGTGAASAHSQLTGSTPAAGSSLSAAPPRVELSFNEEVDPAFATITVVGPDGAQWADGAALAAGSTVSVPLRVGAPAGEFTVGYRVVSADGHPVTGSYTFRLNTPAPIAEPTPDRTAGAVPEVTDRPVTATPTATEERQSSAVWWFIAVPAVLVLGGTLAAVLVVRSRRTDQRP